MRSATMHIIALSVLLSIVVACSRQAPSTTESLAPETAPEPDKTIVVAPDADMKRTALSAQLEERQANFLKVATPERRAQLQKAIQDLTESDIVEGVITKGDKAPDFTLRNALGDDVNLYEELEKGPVILTWYRGSWCPYCNIQLHDYQKSLGEIQTAGAQLIAVSPELPDSALSWKEKNELEFVVLSDPGNKVAREYGVVYRIPDSDVGNYGDGARNDLNKFNGDSSMELPLAVTYVIGPDGAVVYSFVDVDYRKRAETSVVVAVVTRLKDDAK